MEVTVMTKLIKLTTALLLAFGLSITINTGSAWAVSYSYWGWGSFTCGQTLTGFSKKDFVTEDWNLACHAVITEIYAACKTHGGGTGGEAEKFKIDPSTIQLLDLGTGFKINRWGSVDSTKTIDDDALVAEFGDKLPTAEELGCPNDNWSVSFAIGRFNGAKELLSGASSAPNVNGVCVDLNVSLDPDTACQPDVHVAGTGDPACLDENGQETLCNNAASCKQEECLYYHALEFDEFGNQLNVKVHDVVDLTDCVKPTLDFSEENYDCSCDYQVIRKDTGGGDTVRQPCQNNVDLK
jgi:hypothetical protein